MFHSRPRMNPSAKRVHKADTFGRSTMAVSFRGLDDRADDDGDVSFRHGLVSFMVFSTI